jgi:hypothetical protein
VSKTFQVGSGNKVKVYVALLPLGDRTEPTDVTVTTSASAISGATTLAITALTGAIAGGTPMLFDASGTKVGGYLTEDAKLGATSLNVEALTSAIASGATASYTAKLRLLGGTQADVQINADRTDVLVFEDPMGYKDGAITSQSWEIPWTANLLTDDEAYRRVFYAASNAVTGREIWVWQQDPPPASYAVGDGLKGATVITGFKKSLESQGICKISLNFIGQGSPIITRFALV